VGSAAGFGISYAMYQPQVNSLQTQVSTLQSEKTVLETGYQSLNSSYNQLSANYNNLESSYTTLSSDHTQLQSDYNSLDSDYNSLDSDYTSLSQTYDDMMDYYMTLSDDVKSFQDLLFSYTYVPDAYPRVLNDAAIRKTSSAVVSAGVSSTDSWDSYQSIYNYITSNVAYAYDTEMPYIDSYWYVEQDGYEYVTRFYDEVEVCRNMIQTPELTLDIMQGDCDDQAVLAFGMVQYYREYVYGTIYLLYMAHIDFSDGSSHLAVFLPVEGGELCIIDPAGNYLTMSGGSITSNAALSEL